MYKSCSVFRTAETNFPYTNFKDIQHIFQMIAVILYNSVFLYFILLVDVNGRNR